MRIEGLRVNLRLVEPSDAAYIYKLRRDQANSRFLSVVKGTVEDQRRWIDAYKLREAIGSELYFVIEKRNGERCGVVRLYEIEDSKCTWGSWILGENKPAKAALESALISFGVAFEALSLTSAKITVKRGNERAIAFYRRFEMRLVCEGVEEFCFEYSKDQYFAHRDRHMSVIIASNRAPS